MIWLARWWPALALLALLGGLWWWHDAAVSDARVAGAAEQKRVDALAYAEAEREAGARQAAIRAGVKARAAGISKEKGDGLADDLADLAGRYDALRLRWEAHRAGEGGAGAGGAAGLAGAAGVADDAACKAAGWVSFDVASAAAQAADAAIAKDDAWQEWWTAQAEAWPE